MKRKNLVVVHLESIAWQAFNAFPEAFANLRRLMPSSRVYSWYFSSATSTQMAMAYLLHANDCELDAATGPSEPAANNPGLFEILQASGYRTEFLCLTGVQVKAMLPLLAGSLPPAWSTNDFSELQLKFEESTMARPFAIYVWNLMTHVEQAMALAGRDSGPEDVIGGACAVADHCLGALMDILARNDLMDETTILIFGDHGEDYWTHGFKAGLLHAGEPYSHVVHAPLVIQDASLAPGTDSRLASTVDLASTCLDLLGQASTLPFAHSGSSLLGEPRRAWAHSQNFTANQPDAPRWDIRKAFSVSDRSYTLLASGRGLELFNHRLDPTNHSNLLHFFDMDDTDIVPRAPAGRVHSHFVKAAGEMVAGHAVVDRFARLRTALEDQIGRKHAYVVGRGSPFDNGLDPACLRMINRDGRDRFFANGGSGQDIPPGPSPSARSLLGDLAGAFRRRRGGGQ